MPSSQLFRYILCTESLHQIHHEQHSYMIYSPISTVGVSFDHSCWQLDLPVMVARISYTQNGERQKGSSPTWIFITYHQSFMSNKLALQIQFKSLVKPWVIICLYAAVPRECHSRGRSFPSATAECIWADFQSQLALPYRYHATLPGLGHRLGTHTWGRESQISCQFNPSSAGHTTIFLLTNSERYCSIRTIEDGLLECHCTLSCQI